MSPKLYRFGLSIWAAVPELAVAELDFPVEQITINVVEGENFKPEFLKINPLGTIPSLVTDDGKTYTNTTDVVRYIVKTASKKVKAGDPQLIAKIHEDQYDPNFILLAVRNTEEFDKAAHEFPLTFVSNRQEALQKYSASPEGAQFKDFYAKKLEANGHVLKIYKGEISNEDFFKTSTKHWDTIVGFILNDLPAVLPESGFIGGSEPGEADFHVGAWLARVAWITGATKEADGYKALEKELKVSVPAKVASYWQAWAARDSWKKVYAETLH